MNKKIIIVSVILIGISFYGGMKYDQSKVSATQSVRFAAFAGGGGGRRGMNAMGGAASGEIIAKDSTSITIKMRDGSTKIVLVSSSTTVAKSVTGSQTDLTVGRQISAIGTPNSDGSITAETVQLRPAATTSQ